MRQVMMLVAVIVLVSAGCQVNRQSLVVTATVEVDDQDVQVSYVLEGGLRNDPKAQR